jgi:hypothetical protein
MQLVSASRAFVMQRAFVALLVATTAGGCCELELRPSIWPPPDFACIVEELALRDGRPEVVRRVRFAATGVVAYGTATRSVADPGGMVALPVFDRLAVYELVPDCLRTFARRLDRLGVATLDTVQGERGERAEGGLMLRWRAFGAERVITARGRMHGAMAQILAVVNAHLPPGERLAALPAEVVVVPVLRGVPAPSSDAAAALSAHTALLVRHGEDPAWLLDAFALACAAGQREQAEALLQRWQAREALRDAVDAFPDGGGERRTAEMLRRLLPPL